MTLNTLLRTEYKDIVILEKEHMWLEKGIKETISIHQQGNPII